MYEATGMMNWEVKKHFLDTALGVGQLNIDPTEFLENMSPQIMSGRLVAFLYIQLYGL